MLKILVKAVILVFIILSVYFIVHPYACSNLMLGRVTNSMEEEPLVTQPAGDHSELFTPAGDQPLTTDGAQTGAPEATPADGQDIPTYSQADIDYAVASRYVELENEYAKNNLLGKDTAQEISYIVMDDFEMTPQEWEEFLQRATQSNLFDKVRSEQLPTVPAK